MKQLYICDKCARILPGKKVTALTGSKKTGYFCKKCLKWLKKDRKEVTG